MEDYFYNGSWSKQKFKISIRQKRRYKNIFILWKFFLAATDAILAFLGSILNQIDELVSLLDIPKLAVPVLGIALGYPDDNLSLKPRLPKNLINFENSYKELDNIIDELKKYDSIK